MGQPRYGSDVTVETLRRLGVEFAAVNPGASFRGLHDSLVHAGNPELIATLFEGVAVAVAHGYAKAAGKPMAAVVHNLVGLQHASMGIFNAWADQVPMMVLGGAGPADPHQRRPWLDWIHVARWQGLTVREHTKWDDEPVSIEAIPYSLQRAHRISTTSPEGPTYVALDAALQERLAPELDLDGVRPLPVTRVTAPSADLTEIADALANADSPVIVTDYTGRSEAAYHGLIQLAESVAAPVVDLAARHSFPNTHWADRTPDRADVLADADVVLVLDGRDVNFAISEIDHTVHSYRPLVRPDAAVFAIGLTDLQSSGYLDREKGTENVRSFVADTAVALPEIVSLVESSLSESRRKSIDERRRAMRDTAQLRTGASAPDDIAGQAVPTGDISADTLAATLWQSVREHQWLLANGLLRGAVRRRWSLTDWNCHLGISGGAGLGYGVGAAIGASLANRGRDTLVVNIQSDGDLLYTPSGLWTAAHHRLPVLMVTANNRTYGQDRMHQRLMATERGREVGHLYPGIDIEDPTIDLAALAEAQGVEGIGPVTTGDKLAETLERAVDVVTSEHRPVLVDVHIAR